MLASNRRTPTRGAGLLVVALASWACGDDPTSTPAGGRLAFEGGAGCDLPRNLIAAGGPPPNGIPALVTPTMVEPDHPYAAYLRNEDRVLGLVVDGEARAYPHNILWWHEVVNDTLGGRDLAVTYCPLTGSGLVFDKGAMGAAMLDVGVSGLLFANNLMMYDRATRRLIGPQMSVVGRCGDFRGVEPELVGVTETTWERWRALHPGTRVVSDQTGHIRNYTQYRYGTYDHLSDESLLFSMDVDRSLFAHAVPVTAQEPQDPFLDRIYGSCDECEVVLERDSLQLGGTESGIPVSTFSRVVLMPTGAVVIGPGRRDDGLWRLEPDGSWTRLGGSGEGLGQFTRISGMLWRPDSLLWVFDGDRMNVLSWPDTAFTDMTRQPFHFVGGTALSSGLSLASSSRRTGAALGEPIHVLDARGVLIRSFGNTFDIEDPPSDPAIFARRFGMESGDTFWAGHVNRYRLELWSVTGELLRSLEVERPWFEPWGPRTPEARRANRRPGPFLSVVRRSGDILWVGVLVARRGWTPATGPFGYNFDTMLEALDPEDGRLLAGARVQGEMVQVRNDGKLVLRRFDEGGAPVFTFWTPRLVRR